MDKKIQAQANMFSKYELYLTHINSLTNRRQNVTSVYLSVNVIVLGATAFMIRDSQLDDWTTRISTIGLVAAGIAACDLWRRLIIQYRALLSWWYAQLRAMEEQSETPEHLLIKEYQELYEGNSKIGHNIGISRYEIRLTWLFFIIYVLFGVIFIVDLFV